MDAAESEKKQDRWWNIKMSAAARSRHAISNMSWGKTTQMEILQPEKVTSWWTLPITTGRKRQTKQGCRWNTRKNQRRRRFIFQIFSEAQKHGWKYYHLQGFWWALSLHTNKDDARAEIKRADKKRKRQLRHWSRPLWAAEPFKHFLGQGNADGYIPTCNSLSLMDVPLSKKVVQRSGNYEIVDKKRGVSGGGDSKLSNIFRDKPTRMDVLPAAIVASDGRFPAT